MKVYPIRNGEIFEPEVKEERTNKHRKEKEQECNCNRSYEIELTEQEYIQTCNTEQLINAIYKCVMANSWSFSRDGIKRWLEQPHIEKE